MILQALRTWTQIHKYYPDIESDNVLSYCHLFRPHFTSVILSPLVKWQLIDLISPNLSTL
jgi:hypothetical protein